MSAPEPEGDGGTPPAGARGAVVVVATPIGNLGDLSPRARDELARASVIACEDTRRTGKLLELVGLSGEGRPPLLALHAHNEAAQAEELAVRAARGERVVLVSDAGTPAISDPGERLVAAAVAAGVRVEVVPGPSAVIAALVASGLPTRRFCFEGFLPRRGPERAAALGEVAGEERTVVLYEAPHRLARTLADLAEVCGGERRVVIARELTKLHEELWRGTLAEAVQRVADVEPRGEVVLVLDGGSRRAAGPGDVEAAVAERLAAGDRARDAAAHVAASLGVPRNQAYEVAVRLSSGR